MTGSPGRRAPLILIGLGLLALLGAFVTWRGGRASTQARAGELPLSLAGLPLSDTQFGPDAVENVTRLHGQSFPLESGAVGTYSGSGGSATLWVTGTSGDRAAQGMVVAMRDRIAEGRSPFTPVAERQEAGRAVYEFDGMGQRHYYFRAGSLVIWLAADSPLAEQALQEGLDFYGRAR